MTAAAERLEELRREILARWRSRYVWRAFGIGFLVALLFFLPFMIYDNGYFLFYGDYNVQQVPFYQMCHDAVRSGNIGWSWTTDLGANFIGSYSFYLLGSPFFWLDDPLPQRGRALSHGAAAHPEICVRLGHGRALPAPLRDPQRMPPCLAACSTPFRVFPSTTSFSTISTRRSCSSRCSCGRSTNTWPRGGAACLRSSVFVCCFVNYYFFVGQVVFTLIYFFLRLIVRDWKLNLRDFLLLFCEAVTGVLLSCVLLVPTVLAVVQNPRVDNPPEGWSALLYGWNQRYIHILECFFFPPDIPARPNFTPDSEAKWASLGAWLPLFSMTGVIGFLQKRGKHWLKTLLPLLFLMAFVPILNAAFQLFNASYYARWFYMLTLMMSLATVMAVDCPGVNWGRALRWTLAITLGIALPIGLMWQNGAERRRHRERHIRAGGLPHPLLELCGHRAAEPAFARHPAALAVPQQPPKFLRLAIFGVSLITVVYALYFIALGKTQSDDTHKFIIPYALNGGEDISLPDTENCRIDIYDGMDNQAMFWQIPTIQAFHSIVPGSVMEFYPTIGVQRDVGSRPDTDVYGLRGLTSCRWLFDPIPMGDNFGGADGQTPEMPGWTYYADQNGFHIWENQYYIPMGFSYDYYITREEYDAVTESNRHLLLLKAIVLSDEQAERYDGILQHADTLSLPETEEGGVPGLSDGTEPVSPSGGSDVVFTYTEEAYYQDCLDRRSMSCSSFSRDNGGFSAVFTSDRERLVFFSVPYESGWSATVNGEPAQVEKVNVGFMAVKVPAGTSEIRFDYSTPGLRLRRRRERGRRADPHPLSSAGPPVRPGGQTKRPGRETRR